ncbi:rhodanese-like domain-containing protein [Aliarcobacter thereius]|uniref:Rhodanese-like domain-containing protein n=1 Tax=Aliarcobacter thereius TaxID=544718 RepID=A0A5R9HCR8_9BACT|nr:rhodanese-like domain-containing protein [Aliarcobacter thereius]TLS72519.1 rhodanese-like domain-containing protein [Aliarcobacter thereius]
MRKILSILLISGLFMFLVAEDSNLKAPSSEVKELIKKYNLKEIDYKGVKKAVGVGNRDSASAVLIDARPNGKYIRGTIPSSINISDTSFKEDYKQIENINKNKDLIVFCAGYSCVKSPIVANMLKEKGHKNIKVYSGGEPEWRTKNYLEVGTVVVKSYLENNNALLVDARPNAKFMQETIIGSISIPDTAFDKLKGRFPIDKNEKIVAFCAGYECEKSHIIAKQLYDMGYKNVSVYAGGVPQWKKEGLATTAGSKKIASVEKEAKAEFSKNGVKIGVDEGTVDGEWLKELILSNKVPNNIQIVNVLPEKDFKKGHIKGSINIEAEKFSAKDILAKLPKDKSIVFHCSAGSRSLEAWMKMQKEKIDMSEIFYLDAVIKCENSNCNIEVNEPLG